MVTPWCCLWGIQRGLVGGMEGRRLALLLEGPGPAPAYAQGRMGWWHGCGCGLKLSAGEGLCANRVQVRPRRAKCTPAYSACCLYMSAAAGILEPFKHRGGWLGGSKPVHVDQGCACVASQPQMIGYSTVQCKPCMCACMARMDMPSQTSTVWPCRPRCNQRHMSASKPCRSHCTMHLTVIIIAARALPGTAQLRCSCLCFPLEGLGAQHMCCHLRCFEAALPAPLEDSPSVARPGRASQVQGRAPQVSCVALKMRMRSKTVLLWH